MSELDVTDLEAAALGDILNHQPCTAHFIRTCFRESPAKHFSDSAGSVYPMMKRLEKRGLIESGLRREGQRDVRYYSVTSAGREAVRNWLGPPIPENALLTIDPLRTRIISLMHLNKTKRKKWIEQVELSLREKLEQIKRKKKTRKLEESDSNFVFWELADENAIMELKTRMEWLRIVKKKLEGASLID